MAEGMLVVVIFNNKSLSSEGGHLLKVWMYKGLSMKFQNKRWGVRVKFSIKIQRRMGSYVNHYLELVVSG